MTSIDGSVGVPWVPGSAEPETVRLGPSASVRCRRRIHLDSEFPGRHGTTAAVRRATDELADHRNRIVQSLRSAHPDLIVPAEDGDRPWLTEPGGGVNGAAPSVLRQPGMLAVRPIMSTETRSGAADLVIWAGDGFLPVIIRAHRTRDPGAGARCSPIDDPLNIRTDPRHRLRRQRADRLALAHHYRQLQELGCASASARGGVIGRGTPTDGAGRPASNTDPSQLDDANVIVWHDLDSTGASVLRDYDARFGDRLAVARAAVQGGEALALPSRVAECHRCPWWPTCAVELQATGDISLLLTGDDVAAARASGVRTVADLANLPLSVAHSLPLTVIHPSQARVRARAWLTGLPLVRSGPRAAIARADVELDVDAESYGEDGAYLWGALLSGVDVGIARGYRSFVTWEQLPSASQGEVFGAFFGFVREVAAAAAQRGLTFAAICYGRAAEERWMLGLARRYSELPGVPDPREVSDFCASGQWVDLLSEIKRHFLAPGSLRLKDLAGSMGFSWRDPEPGGENSMAWYLAALGETVSQAGAGSGGPAPEMSSAQAARRVLQYNEDDVLATLAVRRWIEGNLASLPTVAELDADPG